MQFTVNLSNSMTVKIFEFNNFEQRIFRQIIINYKLFNEKLKNTNI